MRRRDLLKAAILAPVLPGHLARRHRAEARWSFALDAGLRWSLIAAEGAAVVEGAEIAVVFADGARLALRDLTGVRRVRFGGREELGGWSLVGSAGGIEVTARFEDASGDATSPPEWPRVAVSVRGLAETRVLERVEMMGLRAHGRTDPQRHSAYWVNGYQSWSACKVVVPAETEELGHWMLATMAPPAPRARTRRAAAPSGLGLAFAPTDAGEGRFLIGQRGVRAECRLGRRLVGAAYPPATVALALLPSDDPRDALSRRAAEALGRPLPAEVPAGWCSWYELYGAVTEADVLANLEVARRSFDPRYFRVIQLDDGFQRACGDWDVNAKFPHGHRWLTDAVHAAGFQAGLWLAPFAVADRSGIPVARPGWLLRDEAGAPLVVSTREDWGGRIYALDASQREVQDHLRDLMRHAVDDWGYDYLKLDFLYYGALGTRSDRWQSGAETCRAGLRAMRDGAGRAYLLGCGAPLQHAAGLFDGMRIGEDVDATWEGVQAAAKAALQRAPFHLRVWHNDPDALVVRKPLTLSEAQAWVSVAALSGGIALASDHLPRLGAERLDLLKRAMPVAPVRARALDLATPERSSAPALVAGTARVVALPERWRFRAGDDSRWSAADLDDGAWETIAAGKPWEPAGQDGLDGFGWYRVRFAAPRQPPAGSLFLDLGRIDDADEVYLNGARVGATGSLPPDYHSRWQAYRRYPVARAQVRWGRQNQIAVRVYDGGGPGGWYSFVRGRPPAWVLAPVRSDRWMLAACNWDDEPRRMSLDLTPHGIAGPMIVYDVWREVRLPDADGRWAGTVPARSTTVLSLRRRPRAPCVAGTTRHVVQGVVDVADEVWDARQRVLRARAVRLDDRPYTVTLALPTGFVAGSCRGDAECQLEDARTHRRTGAQGASVRVVFPAPAGRDIAWEVAF